MILILDFTKLRESSYDYIKGVYIVILDRVDESMAPRFMS